MKKLKDFFYNKNDIIIVLIILAIAALIIYTRIGAIMDYPAKLAKQPAATAETTTTEPATHGKRENIGDHRRLRYSFDCCTEDI